MSFFEYMMDKGYSRNTAANYISRLKWYELNSTDINSITDYNKIIQLNAAVKLYNKSKDIYINKNANFIENLAKKIKKPKQKRLKDINLKRLNMKINAIRNIRYKLAFRLIEISGLRISEVSELTKADIEYCENFRMFVTIRRGKGNKKRIVQTFTDKFVFDKIKNLSERKSKLFYKANTMQKEAQRLGFNCHLLRKVFATSLYYKVRVNTEKQRILIVQKCLGHEKNLTYKRYVRKEINLTGTKFDI